jgi:hypothetical protein
MKTARQSDGLLTGVLTAAQRVADPAYSAASGALMQAISKAKNGEDASLKAAEAAWANTVLTVSGASAQSVANFKVGVGAVTGAGVAAAAGRFAGGATASGVIDAQATATVICGATATATTVITGVTAIAAGAVSTPGAGTTAYGKTLLRGSARAAATTQTNYGMVNLATSKVCTCRQPWSKGVTEPAVVIITTCDHTRRVAPRLCLSDGYAQPAPGHSGTGYCDQEQFSDGTGPDTRTIQLVPGTQTVSFQHDPGAVPDRFRVLSGDIVIFDECASTLNTVTLDTLGSAALTVEVTPNCQGATSGFTTHSWSYYVLCGD